MGRGRSRSVFPVGLFALTFILAACSTEVATPEDRIREQISKAEIAVEQGSLIDASALLSDSYMDDNGQDKQSVRQRLAAVFYRYRNIHLFSRIAEIQISPNADSATSIVFVAMASTPITSIESLQVIHADMYRFDLTFELDAAEKWLIRQASWRPAKPEDFVL